MKITVKAVRERCLDQGIPDVSTLVKRVKEVDPEGKGVSGNSLKRWFWDDDSLTSLDRRVLLLLCLTLNCQPSELIALEVD